MVRYMNPSTNQCHPKPEKKNPTLKKQIKTNRERNQKNPSNQKKVIFRDQHPKVDIDNISNKFNQAQQAWGVNSLQGNRSPKGKTNLIASLYFVSPHLYPIPPHRIAPSTTRTHTPFASSLPC
ncbi:hypothetical protein TWF718_003370 [Orbilia javanica]|uniref:Uncharacterized protein n=1 Tax=Orbilia javanica TaxID=47235 RepID=A0AAN8MSN6_9PEZI